jgi:hypothetical protein
MSTVAITAAYVDQQRGSQIQSPVCLKGTFTADDTDDHVMTVASHGKSKMTVGLDNPANQIATVKVYGTHLAAGVVGGTGTFYLGTFSVAAANADQAIAQGAMDSYDDPFPWYLIVASFAVAPDDDPLKTCTVYADISAN